jgi:hypothetical protein
MESAASLLSTPSGIIGEGVKGTRDEQEFQSWRESGRGDVDVGKG